jgi:hypothetical protein
MEIPPPQYPSFPFIPLIPKQARKEKREGGSTRVFFTTTERRWPNARMTNPEGHMTHQKAEKDREKRPVDPIHAG